MTLAAWGGFTLGVPVAAALTEWDRVVEVYELDSLVQRIANVLDAKGVLTVADYQRELQEARNDGMRRFEDRYRAEERLERELIVEAEALRVDVVPAETVHGAGRDCGAGQVRPVVNLHD